MRCAIKHIKEGIIVFIDADGSHIPEDIPKLVKPLQDNKAEMVIGSRFLGGSEELHGDFNKFLRMFYSMCIAQIINWRFNQSIMDTQNGFRAIKVEVAKKLKLKSKHTEIETEMDMKCFKKRFRIIEVPSMELSRKHGESSISLWKHGPIYFWTVIKNLF
jgi:dolichol-phosphate hexosyltransferase